MAFENSKKKNLLDLEHQRILNLLNIAAISVSTLAISATIALWAGQLPLDAYLFTIVISVAAGYIAYDFFETERAKIIKKIKKL
ncbi:MAG: hypothetical protein V1847_04895 [Candidatus Diapherotrites archaeon]